MPTIIDGYNLLRTVQGSIEELADLDDVQICGLLNGFFRSSRTNAEIIFDGIGPPDKSGFAGLTALNVTFSGTRLEADDLIEQRIHQSTAPKLLRIVTNDRRLKKAAARRKAQRVDCLTFWQIVEKKMNKKAPAREPEGKRKPLSEAETDRWMEYFDID